MAVHHIPPENLSTFIALYVTFTFIVGTTPPFHTVRKNFLETELVALSDYLSLYQLSLVPSSLQHRGTQLEHKCYGSKPTAGRN
jgi:hypothetical protein